MSDLKLIFTCPFCNKDILDTDEVGMGEADNIDVFDIMKDSKKVFYHVDCYAKASVKKDE